MRIRLSSFIVLLSSFALLFALCATADQWILDGQKQLEMADPQTAINTATIAGKLNSSGIQFVYVDASGSDTDRGTALLAAYVTAEGMSPAAGNEITIILPPETYDLVASTLDMDTEYINLMGQIPVTVTAPIYRGAELTGEVPKTLIKSMGTAINSTVQNATVSFVRIEGAVFTSGTKAAVWQDVWFDGVVDYLSSTSNTFLRVYSPVGLCVGEQVGSSAFCGRCVSSVVGGAWCLAGGGEMSGTVNNSTISGDYCIGGYGTIFSGTLNNSTISGGSCIAGGGGIMTSAASIINSSISGSMCLGTDGGTVAGTINNSTISGNYCLGSWYGTVSATIINSIISGSYCLGAEVGTISGTLFRCDISGPNQMRGFYPANTVFSFCTGIDSAVTNSAASVFSSTDQNNNPIPNQ